jgi:hypothetical protein
VLAVSTAFGRRVATLASFMLWFRPQAGISLLRNAYPDDAIE